VGRRRSQCAGRRGSARSRGLTCPVQSGCHIHRLGNLTLADREPELLGLQQTLADQTRQAGRVLWRGGSSGAWRSAGVNFHFVEPLSVRVHQLGRGQDSGQFGARVAAQLSVAFAAPVIVASSKVDGRRASRSRRSATSGCLGTVEHAPAQFVMPLTNDCGHHASGMLGQVLCTLMPLSGRNARRCRVPLDADSSGLEA
jgi:hypothetical protein